MPTVLRTFQNGYPGAVSRSIDNIIVSLRNASGADLPFGAPVFLCAGENACRAWDSASCTEENFLGFTARSASKTPETYGSNQAAYAADDPVDVLVRGSVVLRLENNAAPGDPVYLRKADGKLLTAAGAEGTTLRLPGVTVRTARDSAGCAEAVLTTRNIL